MRCALARRVRVVLLLLVLLGQIGAQALAGLHVARSGPALQTVLVDGVALEICSMPPAQTGGEEDDGCLCCLGAACHQIAALCAAPDLPRPCAVSAPRTAFPGDQDVRAPPRSRLNSPRAPPLSTPEPLFA